MQRTPVANQAADRIEIKRRRGGAERLRLRRDEMEHGQYRGNGEPVEVEQPEDAPGEFRVARRSLDFGRLLHGGTLSRGLRERPRRGARLRRGSRPSNTMPQ
jgi:hypothetical protein